MSTMGRLWPLIADFRDMCLRAFPDDVDPVRRKYRDARLQIGWPRDMLRRLTSGQRELTVPGALVWTIRTPRTLKLVLRRTWDIWQQLHGEIDFDDLLVLNALRFGAPPVFGFLRDHMVEIRALEMEEPDKSLGGGDANKNDTQRRRVGELWEGIVAAGAFEDTSVRRLVEWLFPVLKGSGGTPGRVPQGVRDWSTTDYWERALREELRPDDVPDQLVLRHLQALSDGRCARPPVKRDVVNGLINSEPYASSFGHFAGFFVDGTQIREIASWLFEEMLQTHGRHCHGDMAPGFTSLWRVSRRHPVSAETHDAWLATELEKALQVSFRFANDVYGYWRTYREDLIDHRRGGSIRETYISLTRRALENAPDHLLRILDKDHIYSSYRLAVHYSSDKEGGPGFVGEDWRWFADVLLQAGDMQPDVIVPQLAPLLIDSKPAKRRGDHEYLPNRERILGMFGHDLEQLFRLLRAEFDTADFAPDVRSYVEHAQSLSLKEFASDA